jgi:hypothetical protein
MGACEAPEKCTSDLRSNLPENVSLVIHTCVLRSTVIYEQRYDLHVHAYIKKVCIGRCMIYI